MKQFILIMILSTSIFAATHYKTPNIIVEKSPLYCTDYYGEHMLVHRIGDIVDGEYAVNYCSYNKTTILEKMKYISANTNKELDSTVHLVLTTILVILIVVLFTMIILFLFKKEQ